MKRVDWNALGEAERAEVLERPVQAVSDALRAGVRAIFEEVAARGDEALRDCSAKFDGVALESFEVDAGEFEAARAAVPACPGLDPRPNACPEWAVSRCRFP